MAMNNQTCVRGSGKNYRLMTFMIRTFPVMCKLMVMLFVVQVSGGKMRCAYMASVKILNGRNHYKDQGSDKIIILKWVLEV